MCFFFNQGRKIFLEPLQQNFLMTHWPETGSYIHPTLQRRMESAWLAVSARKKEVGNGN